MVLVDILANTLSNGVLVIATTAAVASAAAAGNKGGCLVELAGVGLGGSLLVLVPSLIVGPRGLCCRVNHELGEASVEGLLQVHILDGLHGLPLGDLRVEVGDASVRFSDKLGVVGLGFNCLS